MVVGVLLVLGGAPAALFLLDGVSGEDFSTDGALDGTQPEAMKRYAVGFWVLYGLVFGTVVAVGTTVGSLSLDALGAGSTTGFDAMVGVLAGLCGYALTHLLAALCSLAGVSSEGGFVHELRPETTAGTVGFAAATVVESTGEELVFRAVLVGVLGTVLGVSSWWLVVPVAFMFGVMHVTEGHAAAVATTGVGLLFGAVFVTNGLVAAATAHTVTNVAELLSVTVFDRDHVYRPS